MQTHKWLFSLGVLSIAVLIGCSSNDKIDTTTAEGAYQLAKSYEKDERYEESILYFREVKNKHPYSRFATDAELAIADIEFKREAYAEAEVSYRLFKELHPSHEKMDYVTFRLGLSIFKQLPDTTDRDLTSANKAIIYFDEVITSFSQSVFAKDAAKKKQEAQKMLADKEIYVADWYFKQDEWLSAMGRYEDLLGRHSRLGFDKRALYGATVSAFRAKEQGKARGYLKKLKERFGDSKEYSRAQKGVKQVMDQETADELFETADEYFRDNDYTSAEPMLNQLVLRTYKRPEVFHMLGTIYYDQGKFKKAIRAFERALEIDPSFTDSSVGLSIILNDLGRYDEGRRVFDEAKLMLSQKSKSGDAQMDERFASKHEELGDLYYRYDRFEDALREFQNAARLTTRTSEMQLHIVDCHFEMGDTNQAVRELKKILKENAHYIPALLRLGKAFYDIKQIPEAVEHWESVLAIEPNNSTARDYLRLVQTVQVTSMNEPNIEI